MQTMIWQIMLQNRKPDTQNSPLLILNRFIANTILGIVAEYTEYTEYTYLLGSYTPAFLYTSEAIGIVELTCQSQSESQSPHHYGNSLGW